MLDLEDEIKVFNFSPRVNAVLLDKKVFFVKDVLALDRSLLGFSKASSKEVVDKVHVISFFMNMNLANLWLYKQN